MSRLVFGIEDATSLEAAGGKAYALYRMVEAGFNIPGGFVVSSEAFMAMTPSLEQTILGNFDGLRAAFVAVRSSAVNEDGKEAAWAGQLDTFLNCTRSNLIQRIKQCWDSANSERAKSYAEQKHIQSTKVAALIQEMVQAETSGVAFSAHPVTGTSELTIIEAGFGLGEAVVSGQITPDTYVVHKPANGITEKHISNQEKMLAKDSNGETGWISVGSQGKRQKLTDHQIIEISGICTRLERFFGYPVDVEWAMYGNLPYILQCRPITSIGK